MTRLPVARSGLPILVCLLGLSLAVLIWRPPLALLPFTGFVLTLFFFRDPERLPVAPLDAILSPADGRVVEQAEVADPPFLSQPAVRVSIFLSLLDVHINRSPVAGRVACVHHEEGRFRPAFTSAASAENERNQIGFERDRGRVLTTQIAGVMARRIDCWVRQGETVERGQRIGMIRFGSRIELLMPKAAVEVLVQVGDRVAAGITPVARWAQIDA